jgi:hypothetical protein
MNPNDRTVWSKIGSRLAAAAASKNRGAGSLPPLQTGMPRLRPLALEQRLSSPNPVHVIDSPTEAGRKKQGPRVRTV